MITKLGRLGAVTVVTTLLSGMLGVVPAQASEFDVSPPEVSDFDFSPKVMMVADGDQDITVTATITDETGIRVNESGEGPSVGIWASTQARGGRMKNIGGDTWQAVVTMPQGSVPGFWTVRINGVEDTVGNYTAGWFTHETRLVVVGDKPINTVRPKVTGGRAVVGNILSVDSGVWIPDGVDLSYQWLRNDEPITAATDPAYKIQPRDVDSDLYVTVSASKAGYTDSSVTVYAGGKVARTQMLTHEFRITGSAELGGTLQLETGTMESEAPTIEYQWTRNGSWLPGATGPTHTVTTADAGTEIGLRINVDAVGYFTLLGFDVPAIAVPMGELQTPPTTTIKGAVAIGETLTVDPGVWGPGEVALSYQWHRGSLLVKGATTPIYKLTEADVGETIQVFVTGTKPGYAPQTAAASVVLGRVQLTAPERVTIIGTPQTDQVLTVDPGVWSAEGVTFTYEWHRNARYSDGVTGKIDGAIGASYKVKPEDVYHSIWVFVRGSKPGHTDAWTSAHGVDVWPATLNQSTPKLSGVMASGQTLTVDPGTWTPGTKFTYLWLRDGHEIPGATKSTYKLTSKDVGTEIRVYMTGEKPGYTPGLVNWQSTPPAKVMKAATPKVSGTLAVGSTMKVSKGSWTSSVKFTYQWLRDGTTIKKATKTSYKLTNADAGKSITVRVTGKRSGYETIALTSTATTKVMKAAKPKISGTKKTGKTLTAEPGSWLTGTSFTYQWYANGKAIKGATGAKLTLAKAQKKKKITVKVTGRQPGHATIAKTSAKTTKVK